MKFEISMLLGLLAVNSAMAADVLQVGVYGKANCAGDAVFQTTMGVSNQCLQSSSAASMKFTCSEREIFNNADCAGTGTKSPVATGCATQGEFSAKTECLSIPDGKIAKVSLGTSCEDGELSGVSTEVIFVLDTCTSFATGASGNEGISFELTAVDDGIKFTFFTEKSDCTGESQSETIPVNKCSLSSAPVTAAGRRRLQGEEQIAMMVVPAVQGATLGANAMSASAGVLAFVVAMIAALATIA